MVKPSTSGSSPLSPTRWPADAFAPGGILLFVVAIAAALFIGTVSALFLVAFAFHAEGLKIVKDSPQYRWAIVLMQGGAYIPVVAVVLALLPRVARRPLRDLGFRWPRGSEIGAGLLGALAMYAAVAIVAILQFAVGHVKAHQQTVEMLAQGNDPVWIAAFTVLAVVLAPFVEESVFRGFVFNAILRYAPFPVAAVTSGVLFAAGHLEWTAALPLAFGGMVLAFVYYRTGSLAASAIAHGTFNLVNVAAVVATHGAAS